MFEQIYLDQLDKNKYFKILESALDKADTIILVQTLTDFVDDEFETLIEKLHDKFISKKHTRQWPGTVIGGGYANQFNVKYDEETLNILRLSPWRLFARRSNIDLALMKNNKEILFTTPHENWLLYDETKFDRNLFNK